MTQIPSSLPTLELGQNHKALIQGPAGSLEYKLEMPKQALQGIMLICHPHPLYQGTMDNKVVYTLSRLALQAGCASLRFQFRGVGRSSGPHDEGQGEAEDAAFLLNALRQAYPHQRSFAAGFSFGAYMALKVAAQDEHLSGLITVAPPLAYAGLGKTPQALCDWLVLHGDADEVVSFEDTQLRAQALQQPPEWVTIEGAGHFFHGQLNELREHCQSWLVPHLAGEN